MRTGQPVCSAHRHQGCPHRVLRTGKKGKTPMPQCACGTAQTWQQGAQTAGPEPCIAHTLSGSMDSLAVTVRPLTPSRWRDLEAVFGARGCSVARGCWCMFYRESGRQSVPAGTRLADLRRQRMQTLCAAGPPPGLIAYAQGQPVGWVTLGPRQDFLRLARSPVMKPVDDAPVWSVVASWFRRSPASVASPPRYWRLRWRTRPGVAHALSKPIRSTARRVLRTMRSGLARSRCSTRQASPKSRVGGLNGR